MKIAEKKEKIRLIREKRDKTLNRIIGISALALIIVIVGTAVISTVLI